MQIKVGRRFRFAVNKSTMKFHGRLFGFHWYCLLSMNPKVHTVGLTNRLPDGRMVVFLDYDNVFISLVNSEVRMLQKKFDIGSAAIICSGGTDFDDSGREYGNFHVIALGKMRFHELFDAIEETSVDRNFRRVPYYFNQRAHVLRIAPKYSESWKKLREKPELKDVLWAKTGRECSRAMYEFLRRYYGVPAVPKTYLPRFDSGKALKLINYQTTEGGWKNEFLRVVGWQKRKSFKDAKGKNVMKVSFESRRYAYADN